MEHHGFTGTCTLRYFLALSAVTSCRAFLLPGNTKMTTKLKEVTTPSEDTVTNPPCIILSRFNTHE